MLHVYMFVADVGQINHLIDSRMVDYPYIQSRQGNIQLGLLINNSQLRNNMLMSIILPVSVTW